MRLPRRNWRQEMQHLWCSNSRTILINSVLFPLSVFSASLFFLSTHARGSATFFRPPNSARVEFQPLYPNFGSIFFLAAASFMTTSPSSKPHCRLRLWKKFWAIRFSTRARAKPCWRLEGLAAAVDLFTTRATTEFFRSISWSCELWYATAMLPRLTGGSRMAKRLFVWLVCFFLIKSFKKQGARHCEARRTFD